MEVPLVSYKALPRCHPPLKGVISVSFFFYENSWRGYPYCHIFIWLCFFRFSDRPLMLSFVHYLPFIFLNTITCLEDKLPFKLEFKLVYLVRKIHTYLKTGISKQFKLRIVLRFLRFVLLKIDRRKKKGQSLCGPRSLLEASANACFRICSVLCHRFGGISSGFTEHCFLTFSLILTHKIRCSSALLMFAFALLRNITKHTGSETGLLITCRVALRNISRQQCVRRVSTAVMVLSYLWCLHAARLLFQPVV